MKPRQPPRTCSEEGANSSRSCQAWKMWEESPRTSAHITDGGFFGRGQIGSRIPQLQGMRHHLSSWRRASSASSASGRWRPATTSRPSIPPRPSARSRRARGDLALLGLPPLRRAARRPARARPDAAGSRRPARRAPRDRRALGQERRRQPDPLLQGPGRGGGGREGEGARLRDGRLRLHREPRQRGRSPRRGGRARLLRLRPGRPRGAEAARHRHLRHQPGRRPAAPTTTSTGSAPSSPRPGPGPSSTSTFAPTTPRARRRSPTRRSSSSAGSCPTGSSPDRLRARCSRSSAAAITEWLEIGLVEGELPTFCGAQADGCSPVATAFAEGWDVCKPQKPDTIAKSLAIGDPADGPYALELARRPAARSSRSATTRSGPGSGCSPRPPGSSPRPRAA